MTYDLVIVGAGVLGTFHAFHALNKGLKVALLEKDIQPASASVRNFGQIVPSGMPQGTWQRYGIESTHIYQQLQKHLDITVRQEGSVYLASDEEELNLLHELHTINARNDYPSVLLRAEACHARYPGLRASYCKGGLLFPQEITVEPRDMLNCVLGYLQTQGLRYAPGTTVLGFQTSGGQVQVLNSRRLKLKTHKVVICSGSDFKILYPDVFDASDLEVSKLHMLQTYPQAGYSLPGSILTGLTIRRYESFRECPSYALLQSDHLDPRLKDWGIHILLKQAPDGSIILGDSHEYQPARHSDRLGFDLRSDINDLMLQTAKTMFELPDWRIARSWFGRYAQCRQGDILMQELEPNIHLVTGIGGKGMTASPALAKVHLEAMFA